MPTDEHKVVLQRFFAEVGNQGQLDVVDEVFAAEHRYVVYPVFPDGARGPQPIKQVVSWLRTVFPDLHFTVDELLAEGETVVARVTARATHLGEAAVGRPPTGTAVRWRAVLMCRFRAGQVVETHEVSDATLTLQQLGILPPPTPTTTPAPGA